MQNLVNSWKDMKELKMPQDSPASCPAESFVESPCEKTGKEKAFPGELPQPPSEHWCASSLYGRNQN